MAQERWKSLQSTKSEFCTSQLKVVTFCVTTLGLFKRRWVFTLKKKPEQKEYQVSYLRTLATNQYHGGAYAQDLIAYYMQFSVNLICLNRFRNCSPCWTGYRVGKPAKPATVPGAFSHFSFASSSSPPHTFTHTPHSFAPIFVYTLFLPIYTHYVRHVIYSLSSWHCAFSSNAFNFIYYGKRAIWGLQPYSISQTEAQSC